MSKKLEAIKEMVFYTQQKPEKLATVIAGLVEDIATSIEVTGADSIKIGEDDVTSTYKAFVFSQYGDSMSGQTITFSLKESVTGVSVNESTGVVTVESTTEGDSFTVVATSGTLTVEKTVTLVASN